MSGLQLVGGYVEQDEPGGDVTVHAPTANLSAQALVTNESIHALLVPREEDSGILRRCILCKSEHKPIAVVVNMPDGAGIRVCLGCLEDRTSAHRPPLTFDLELMA